MSESERTASLREAFLDAYPMYVAALLQERGIELDVVMADAIVEGTAVLDGLLTTLGRTPLEEQRVSPLELFREALRPIDRALALRDAPASADSRPLGVAPWDRYELSPGSSQVLGTDAHDAHLRWAVTKAAAFAPAVLAPAAFVVSGDRSGSLVFDAVRSIGYRTVSELSPEAAVAVVDSSIPSAHALVSEAVGLGVYTVVYGDDMDDLETTAARALGASAVVAQATLVLRPEEILPSLA